MNHASDLPPQLDEIFVRSDRMVGRRIAEEYLLVPIVGRAADVEAIYTLNAIAAFIWERLDGETPGKAMIRAIAERYDVNDETAMADYLAFIEQLQSIQAVVPADAPPHTNARRAGRGQTRHRQEDES
jgi:Coenzyme PQQ synthesis protein D (PqqD)